MPDYHTHYNYVLHDCLVFENHILIPWAPAETFVGGGGGGGGASPKIVPHKGKKK